MVEVTFEEPKEGLRVGELESKPAIHIHLDQQVTIEAIQGQEEVEDATVATEITGFDVEDDLYVLRGALSFTGFLRQDDPAQKQAPIPDAFDDRDVFDTVEEEAEAPVLPFHYRLPFILQVPVAAQQAHQRETGILSVNPRIGQWNVHVLGEGTAHVRAELIIQGLTGADGYVFRCGSQEEGAVASKLDHLLDKEEARTYTPPQVEATAGEEFEAPFEPWQPDAGAFRENTLYAEQRDLHELADSAPQEDDWMIETPDAVNEQAAQDTQEKFDSFRVEEADEEAEEETEEENQVIFTPDPSLVFPMPDPNSQWARELEAADRAFGEQVQQSPFLISAPFSSSASASDQQVPLGKEEPSAAQYASESPIGTFQGFSRSESAEEEAFDTVSDEDAFVVEEPEAEETRAEEEATYDAAPYESATESVIARARAEVAFRGEAEEAPQDTPQEPPQETPQESRTEVEEKAVFEAAVRENVEDVKVEKAVEVERAAEVDKVADVEKAVEVERAAEVDKVADVEKAVEVGRTVEVDKASEVVETTEAVETVTARTDEAESAEFETAEEEAQMTAVAESFTDAQSNAEEPQPQDEEERTEATQEQPLAEYVFEDEVPPQETPAEAVQETGPKSFAPKLSLGSKSTTVPTNEPIKLSQLLGDSRTETPVPEAEAGQLGSPSFGSPSFGSPSFAESAQLVRESLSYAELNAEIEADDEVEVVQPLVIAESASIATSAKGHGRDSFWREILRGHDEKVTMKFRIVQEDDSLPDLAEHYHTTINELLRANNLQRQEVDAGQILYIPARKR